MSTKASKNPDSNSNSNPSAQPSSPSSPPNPSIDLGYAAAQREYEEQIGESSGKRKHRAAKLVALRVKSVATDSDFIPLASAHDSLSSYRIVGTTWRPVKGDEMISLPSVETKTGLEFHHKTIQAFGVVLTRVGQLVLLPANGLDQPLPDGSELVGTIPAPKGTHLLRVHDRVTDEEMYTLGIVFPNTARPDWVQLALDRREKVLAELEEERREREAERRAELEEAARAKKDKLEREARAAKPVPTFATFDKEVIYSMQEAYAVKYHRLADVTRSAPDQPYRIEDPDTLGPAIAVSVAAKREELGSAADAHFERERDAREYAASLQK